MKDESTIPTILVADDQQGQRAVVDMLLSVDGYRVVTVDDGRQALDWLAKNTPDLAVLDVRMPHLDGIEICRRIRKVSRLRAVPVVILTGMRDEATTASSKAAGANAVVHKPLEGKDFRATVRALIDDAAKLRASSS
ncbi:MAG: response regulator [Trueperaceae bacterium]|nr:response regulator [Trueperaceae bacterium]